MMVQLMGIPRALQAAEICGADAWRDRGLLLSCAGSVQSQAPVSMQRNLSGMRYTMPVA